MPTELTKDARKALKDVYDLYCGRRQSGQSKKTSMYFDAPRWGGGPDIAGMDDATDELKNAGYIKTDITGGFELTDRAIIFMENVTKNNVLKWINLGA